MAEVTPENKKSLAGVGRVDITPPVGGMLEAYHRDQPSTGILDRLCATALALSAEATEPFLLLTIDNAALLVSEADRLRDAVAARSGIGRERVMVCLSHTHSGPRVTQGYLAKLEESVCDATKKALAGLESAELGWGIGHADASVNRRPQTEARAEMRIAERSVDQRLGVLRVDKQDGKPLAVLVWYGAHASVLTGDSNVISADWPGAVRSVMENALDCPILVATGSAGDVNPRWRGSEDALQRMGQTIGGEALKVRTAIETSPLTMLKVWSTTIPLRLQPLPGEEQAERMAAEAEERWNVPTQSWLAEISRLREEGEIERSLPLEVQVAGISSGILGGIPMEPFSEIGQAVAAYWPEKPIFFGGHVNGWIGYLPTPEEYAAGGYEVEWGPVVYGPESGWLTPAVPEMASEVISSAVQLISSIMGEKGHA